MAPCVSFPHTYLAPRSPRPPRRRPGSPCARPPRRTRPGTCGERERKGKRWRAGGRGCARECRVFFFSSSCGARPCRPQSTSRRAFYLLQHVTTHRWPSGEKTVMARSYLAMVARCATGERERDEKNGEGVRRASERKTPLSLFFLPTSRHTTHTHTPATPCGSFGGPACPRARPGTGAGRAGPRWTRSGEKTAAEEEKEGRGALAVFFCGQASAGCPASTRGSRDAACPPEGWAD